MPQLVAESPGDISPVKPTQPLILFALIRALAVSAAAATAFGLHVPNADWMPGATLVAKKPGLEQSTPAAEQRVAGAIIGAAAAALFLLTITGKTVVEVAIVVLGAPAGAIRTVNYAFCTAAVAGAVLIAMDLPHPSSLADEERRSSSPSSAWASPSSSCSSPTGLSKHTAKAAAQAA